MSIDPEFDYWEYQSILTETDSWLDFWRMSSGKCQTAEQSNFHKDHTESMHFAGKICNEALLRYT